VFHKKEEQKSFLTLSNHWGVFFTKLKNKIKDEIRYGKKS